MLLKLIFQVNKHYPEKLTHCAPKFGTKIKIYVRAGNLKPIFEAFAIQFCPILIHFCQNFYPRVEIVPKDKNL